jgi:hypothetical protein
MRDLSYQDALDDPEMPFRRFVAACTELWNRAVVIYEAAGSPNGPALEGNNVSSWFETRMDAAEAVEAANELLSSYSGEPCE